MNRTTIQQVQRTQQGLANVANTRSMVEGAAAVQRVLGGDRAWASVKLASDWYWRGAGTQRHLIAHLPRSVLNRADGISADSPHDMFLELLAYVPSESPGEKSRQIKQALRKEAEEAQDGLLALAYACEFLILKRDPDLARLRKRCWRPSGTGWRVTRVVELAVAATGWHPDALHELNRTDLITEEGFHLGPAVVEEGGALACSIDYARPQVDMAALRLEQQARVREYEETLERIRLKRRSLMVNTGQNVLPDRDKSPSTRSRDEDKTAGQGG